MVYPRSEYTVVDRGFGTPCHVVPTRKATWTWLNRLLGPAPPGLLRQHLCERYGEPNRCVNPAHVTVGTKSSNAQHMHDLRAAAGVPWTGAPKVGIKRGPYRKRQSPT